MNPEWRGFSLRTECSKVSHTLHIVQLWVFMLFLSTESLTRVRDRPGKTQQTRIFCGKTLLLTSSGARVQEREWRNPVPFKENYSPPRTYYSLIGCSPSAQLSRERQNTWRENCPCTCADYVYHLEHSCQHHLIMANVRAAPNISPFSFNKKIRAIGHPY